MEVQQAEWNITIINFKINSFDCPYLQWEFFFLWKYSCETTLEWNIFRFLLCMGFHFTLKLRNPHCIPELSTLACTIPWLRGAADSEGLIGTAQILPASRTKENTNLSMIRILRDLVWRDKMTCLRSFWTVAFLGMQMQLLDLNTRRWYFCFIR